jgi:hypothetical protein
MSETYHSRLHPRNFTVRACVVVRFLIANLKQLFFFVVVVVVSLQTFLESLAPFAKYA